MVINVLVLQTVLFIDLILLTMKGLVINIQSFPLTISSVNVTKSEVSCGFGNIYWRNPLW